MSSILPSKNTPNSERLSDLNTKVISTCVDHDVLFADNDVNFTFGIRAVNDAAFQRDGIHPSDSGTDRLLRNLDLPKQPVRRKQRQRHEITRRSAMRVDEIVERIGAHNGLHVHFRKEVWIVAKS